MTVKEERILPDIPPPPQLRVLVFARHYSKVRGMIKRLALSLLGSARWWLGLPALVTLLGLVPETLVSRSTLLLLYLCSVLYTSLHAGQVAVLACAVISYLLFSFFHTPAPAGFPIQEPGDVVAVAVFFIFAFLAGTIAGRLSRQLARLEDASRVLKDAERKSDEERLRSSLLASVSHDLKTPLVTMLGAATSLRDLRADLSNEDAAELLDSIISESRRLESYIQNLLDMTRLGHGKLALTRDWVSVEEIWHVIAKRIARQRPGHSVTYRQDGVVATLHVHAALIEQALFNVIDNSMKAGGPGAEILVSASGTDSWVTIRVQDHGPGLPESEWEKVFDQFYTFSLGDHYEKGTGLGLSICRSIMRVHMGEARIVPPLDGYRHCVELILPVAPVQPGESSSEGANEGTIGMSSAYERDSDQP
jgi:two-component system sensor histidine kinase KdpD